MTKRNLTLGTASGKLGSVVYFRRRGQQIARVLVSQVNDKKTIGQCFQRAKFANYVSAWRLVKQYVGSSWLNASRYGTAENAFYHHNRALMPCISKEMSRLGYGWPPLGIITYGSLPSYISAHYGKAMRVGQSVGVNMSYLPYGKASAAPSTIAEFSSVIVGAGYGLAYGDILHILYWSVPIASFEEPISAGEEVSPKLLHASINLNAADDTLLFDAAPWWNIRLVSPEQGGYALELDLASAYDPADPTDGFSYPFFAVWVERPSNKSHARFSRGRIVGVTDAYNLLKALTEDTLPARSMALSYMLV